MFGTFHNNIKQKMMSNTRQLSSMVGQIQSGIMKKQRAKMIAEREMQAKSSQPSQAAPAQTGGSFIDPMGGLGTLTSNFNAKRSSGIHGAVDIAAPAGTPVKASMGGKVIGIDFHKGGFGHVVAIQHDNGLQSLYAHLRERPNVKIGQSISQGQAIGSVGSTGFSTGNHLDFRIGKRLYQNGVWNFAKDADVIDPLSIIKFSQPKNWLD